ncbi:hypothetical protein [Arthrobacter sp. JUb115]|uniref:hypothetical protein n=1 Tax=Arthrobacter sp. JUb115 TaxID=2485108 RepID=UPI00105C7F85|nr:hypothetical protein [Arthrobacter sp. JUb115]TDU29314.1 hypothetical protein EDF61_10253 [Arthrobacter sp. JUb115]
MSSREVVIDRAMKADAVFAGQVISALTRPQLGEVAPIVSFCLGSYFSLFVYEGYARLPEVAPQLCAPLSALAQSVTARSRHSLKFFEDTHRGIEGQIAYFDDEIFPAHKSEFLGNTWLPFARRWETDLGLYRYAGRLVSTTHSATFGLGLDPQTMFDENAGPELVRIMTEYGQYFGALGATMDSTASSFLDDVDASQFGELGDDVRSERYYQRIFNGVTTPSINALMTVFQVSMNFVDGLVPSSLEYSLFKIRFLTVYQVLRSLEMLRAERSSDLSAESLVAIAGIVDTAEAQLIIDSSAKPFRNTLMHYGPDNRIDLSTVNEDNLIGSLVPLCYGGIAATDFAAKLDACIAQTAAGLNAWAQS